MNRVTVIMLTQYFFLTWFTSALFPTLGLYFFLGSAVVLAVCLFAARRGKKHPLFLLYLVALMCAVTLGLGELGLRAAPQLTGGVIANHAYGGYHVQPGGIYRRDEHIGYALKPNYSRAMYWNGHWWKHETNSDSYRGARVERADVVFLGDSMIYGHGVENELTVPSQFQQITGRTAANLGQQGTCLVQSELRLRDIGTKLKPRVVVVCSHPNDIGEALGWYPEEELVKYVAAPADVPCDIRARSSFQPKPWWHIEESVWNSYLAPSLRFPRAVGALTRAGRPTGAPTADFASTSGGAVFVPPPEVVAEPFAPWEPNTEPATKLGWQVHRRALTRINDVCKQNGARLVLIDLGYPRAFASAIEDAARELGVQYVPAGRAVLARAQVGEEVYLANDGHWSPLGCRTVSEELARALKQ